MSCVGGVCDLLKKRSDFGKILNCPDSHDYGGQLRLIPNRIEGDLQLNLASRTELEVRERPVVKNKWVA